MGQYFTNDPMVKSQPKSIEFDVNNHIFSLKTDNGVFSKKHVDDGSLAFLKVLTKQEFKGRILDLGCGYGTIGLVLAYFNKNTSVVMADVNIRACALARENAKQMKLENVEIYESNEFDNLEGKFTNIVINPPIRAGKKVIYSMFQKAHQFLSNQGSLFIVIRKSQGAESAQKFISSVFGNCTLMKRDKGYYIYQAIKDETKKTN